MITASTLVMLGLGGGIALASFCSGGMGDTGHPHFGLWFYLDRGSR